MQGLVVTCKRGVIDAADLAGISHESCQASAGENCWYPKIEGRSLKSIMRDVENAVIEQGLKRYGSLVSFSAICIWTAARRSEKSKAGNLPNRMNVCLQKLSVAGPHKKVQFMPSRSCKQIFARAQRRAAAPALRQGLQQDDEEPPATKDVCLILPYGRRERQKNFQGVSAPVSGFWQLNFALPRFYSSGVTSPRTSRRTSPLTSMLPLALSLRMPIFELRPTKRPCRSTMASAGKNLLRLYR